jgi:hypothetical protein
MKTLVLALTLISSPAFASCTPGVLTQDQSAITMVDELYVKLLGRHAEATGQAYWAGYLNCGVSLAEAERVIRESAEFKARR